MKKLKPVLKLLFFLFVNQVISLDNGLVRTPPMGWLHWQRYRCQIDCKQFPNSCINENLYMDIADRFVSDGWKDAGYQYINIDDCWTAKTRDPITHEQRADPDRFPHGIKYLADYIHSKGLKFGLYSDIGSKTCGGYLGMEGFFELDAKTFASWEIDYLKVDGCHTDHAKMNITYPQLGDILNKTGRPIVYSCSWPAYLGPPYDMPHTPYDQLQKYCNLWRNWNDIDDSWTSLKSIINHWDVKNDSDMIKYQGPGAWNDPDMLLLGDFGLSVVQQQTQFALWAIFAAPLIMSNDLRDIASDSKAILQNKEIIAINQDPKGKQGYSVYKVDNSLEVWIRWLSDGSLACVLQNLQEGGDGQIIGFYTKYVAGLSDKEEFTARELFKHQELGTFFGYIGQYVRPSGVTMLKLTFTGKQNNLEK